MFNEAVIHYPNDDITWNQICKDIAATHCAAAVKYMESINLDNVQKAVLIDSLIKDVSSDP